MYLLLVTNNNWSSYLLNTIYEIQLEYTFLLNNK